MKKFFTTMASCLLLLLLLHSCKKVAHDEAAGNNTPANGREAVQEEPITPLGRAIPLPAGSSQVQLNTQSGVVTTHIPIIMVHGLGGFGPGEFGSFNYWGGVDNIPLYLTNNGYPAYATSVGPFSSNFDRAVDLYYYIKGGYVDYGKFHSTQYGHHQTKSRYYPGVYPEWDANHPVHLLGHSMGGITVRKLLTLLEQGDKTELQDPAHAELFSGGKTGWVKSVTTISTPHNGATLTYKLLPDYAPFVKGLVIAAAGLAGASLEADALYDFDLEQWDLEREPGESFAAYAARVGNSRIWTTEDYSGHDVTPEAARDWNQAEPDSKNVYYFSVTTKNTTKGLLTGWEYPRLTTFPALIPVAFPVPIIMGLGNYTQNTPGKVVIDEKWWANDGAANVYGMSGPNTSIIKPYAPDALEKGVWNHIGVYNGYDHFAIIGMGMIPYNVRPFYMNLANLLAAVE